MEPGSGGAPLQVLGEKEALQQFFSGSLSTDVLTELSCVLDSSAAVDTSILEQYLSLDADPSHFILPDSPPDSIPEACSPPPPLPPHIADFPPQPPHWPNQPSNQEVYQPPRPLPSSSSCGFKSRGSAPLHPQLLTHDQLRTLGLTNTYVKPGPSPSPPPEPRPHQHTHLHSPPHTHHLNAGSCWQVCTPPTPPLPAALGYSAACVDAGSGPASTQPPSVCLRGPPYADLYTCSEGRKRRRSEAEEALAAAEGEGPAGAPAPLQLLAWDQYRPADWCVLLDHGRQTLGWPAYHVDTDKGFSYSPADEAFVCQKKNHFQVTVHIGVASEPCYVQTDRGRQQVEHFQIQVFGIKLEAPSQLVTIEQSQSDRSKKPFRPVRVSLPGGQITKVTLGRLHFGETTNNNMRKKGKPNPDQRYFQMVVGLYATVKEESFLLTALVSERLIVRASNPGQFEMEGDTLWQRGIGQDAVVCQGRVGINTDSPDEALVVCGNAKVMGAVMQPSDRRAKHNIQQVDSEQQLRRITQMRLVEFDYKPEFASSMGIDHTHQTGILAQEVKELLPSAVKEVGDITCSDGEKIPNFLMVDKEQIFMENVGAVQQLSKLTDNLESRINELEVWNQRLAKLKSLKGSLRSARKPSSVSAPQSPEPCKSVKDPKKSSSQKRGSCLQHRVLQASIFTLLTTMAFCVISITALYLLTLRDQDMELFPSNSSSSVDPLQTTVWSSSAPPTSAPGPWPPDVDFCDLLYCDQVYCCPSPPARGAAFNLGAPGTAAAPASELIERRRKSREELYKKLMSARSDWTNTTIGSFTIKESQQAIDSRYCLRDECGPGRFAFRVPISQFLPVNMRVTLLMNSTELLVVHLCGFEETASCSALLDASAEASGRYPPNTQGEHEWPLHVARLHHSSYHFRSTVAGQADCSTDHHYAGALFTDYHFHFYRRCESW